MSDELPLSPHARRRVLSPAHFASIQRAALEPVERHPADDTISLVGSVVGRKRGRTQVRIGADGTRVVVAWGPQRPEVIIHVSPPGGES